MAGEIPGDNFQQWHDPCAGCQQESNPDLHKLLSVFQQMTGHGLLINASLSRPGEALICTPEDAVNFFLGTDLNYMIMEDVLVTKRERGEDW